MRAALAGAYALSLARASYGAVLLCAPGAVVGLCTGRPAGPRVRTVARVLGARHVAQAALTARTPSTAVLAGGALVDLAHAASMLALAAGDRPMRRAEFADGLAAAVFALTGMASRD